MSKTDKKILIISPHFPPSNLAAVHRSRLFAQHLPSFGWQPTVLMVHEDFYEEKLDRNLEKLLADHIIIEKVKAFKVTKPRLVGDIGLRGFFQLYRKAKALIKEQHFDFLYIPIPSFYVALLGRWLHESTGIIYGIDYIDPWVHEFAGANKVFSRHWFSTKISKWLEPIAIKKAKLITGVAEGYYKGVKERNPHLLKQAIFEAMPYGGEKNDHTAVRLLQAKPYLFKKQSGKLVLVYAGAMLPKAYSVLRAVFKSINTNRDFFKKIEIHFIGTGKSPNDPDGFNIKSIAKEFQLWETIIFEYPKRIPYLDVLVHLEEADGVFVLGSTEPHYTPSKVYQAVLSGKPILAILHKESTAASVVVKSGAGIVLAFNGESDVVQVEQYFTSRVESFIKFRNTFDPSAIQMDEFEKYSAYNVTGLLAASIDKATQNI